jgi:hypothetical protein
MAIAWAAMALVRSKESDGTVVVPVVVAVHEYQLPNSGRPTLENGRLGYSWR